MANIDVAFESIKEGWNFAKKNYAKLFKKIVTINLLAIAVLVAGVLIIALLGLGVYGLFGPVGGLVALLAVIPLLFLVSVAMTAVESVVYNVISKWPAPIGINETANKNLKPVFFYSLAMAAVSILVIIIEFVIGFGMGLALYTTMNEATASAIIDVISNLIDMTANLIIGFLFQFVLFELIITRMGAVESLKKSVDIAVKNFVPTVVFDIIVGLLAIFAAVVLALPLVILLIAAMPVVGALVEPTGGVATLALSMGLSAEIVWALIAIAIGVILVIFVVIGALVATVTLPMEYTYWKKVRGNEAEKKARPAPPKR